MTNCPVESATQSQDPQNPARAIELGRVISDRFPSAGTHLYTLHLNEGQAIRVAVLDAKLDSRGFAKLRITDPSGAFVTSARSTGDAGAICIFTARRAGDYRIELSEAVYRGGEEVYYALFAESADQQKIDPSLLPWDSREHFVNALVPAAGQLARNADPATASLAKWIRNDCKFIKRENAADVISLESPCLVSGAFGSDSKSHEYELNVANTDPLHIEIISARLGENADPSLAIYDLNGQKDPNATPKRLLNAEDTGALGTVPFTAQRLDPIVEFRPPAPGKYRIVVRDQWNASTARLLGHYALAIRKLEPSFTVLAGWSYPINTQPASKPIGNNLSRGGSSALRIIIDRQDGFTGAVEVQCKDLPKGITSTPSIIPANATEGYLIINASPDAAGFTGPIGIEARAISAAEISSPMVAATPIAIQWEASPTWNTVTNRVSSHLYLHVNDKETLPLTFASEAVQDLKMARGGKLPMTLAVVRRDNAKDKITLRPQNLPPKVTLGDVAIDGSASEAKPELVIAPDATPGQYTFWFQSETKIKFSNHPELLAQAESDRAAIEKLTKDPAQKDKLDALNEALKGSTERVKQLKDQTALKDLQVFLPWGPVRLRVLDTPFEIPSAWKIEAVRGKPTETKLEIARLFGFEGTVTLSLADGGDKGGLDWKPGNVAEKETLASGTLNVAADAAVGQRNLQMKLSYKFNNQDLSAVLPVQLVVRD